MQSASGREAALGQNRRRLSGHVPANRQWTPLGRALTVTGDNWTLVIALQLASGRTRLSQLREQLSGVSAGVLDRYVRQMAAAGLVTRTRFREMPPRVELELTDAGRELLPIAGALARWGLRRAWTPPQHGERVDPDALLRLLPVLLEEDAELPPGTLEVGVTDGEETVRHRFAVRDGRLEALGPGSKVAPTASICGAREAWLAALGPEGHAQGLEIAGEERLARVVLASLARPA